MMWTIIKVCVVKFNMGLFFAHYDIMNVMADTIGTLQMFRAIGLMASTGLPEGIYNFYSKLGLLALDVEFGQPVRACVRA